MTALGHRAAPAPRELSALSRAECLDLLASQSVARLAFTRRALPDVIPVNFVLDGESALIRVQPGSAVARAVAGAVVAIQADDLDREDRTGWSVTAVGEACEVLDPGDLARVADLVPLPWARGDRSLLIRIPLTRVAGRRLDA